MSHENPSIDTPNPDGIYMEKYREEHEREAMQQHDCGRTMMEYLGFEQEP